MPSGASNRLMTLTRLSPQAGDLPQVQPAPARRIQTWELQPETPTMKPLRSGDGCPACQVGRLDYDGLLNLSCSRCGYSLSGGAGCT